MTRLPFCRLLATSLAVLACSSPALAADKGDNADPESAGRYGNYTQKAKQGPKATVVAATYFGGPGIEDFVAAAGRADGAIIAVGNCWGPQFATLTITPTVLGKGAHKGLNPYGSGDKKGGGKPELRANNPDRGGMVVVFDSTASKVLQVVRFDFGVAAISAGTSSSDGKSLIIAGLCGPAFSSLGASAGSKHTKTQPPIGKGGGITYDSVTLSGDAFVMKLDATSLQPQWTWVLPGHGEEVRQVWMDNQGTVYADCAGLSVISADGNTLNVRGDKASGDTAGWRAVNPQTGEAWYGGDRNTHTGSEPYRQPYLYRYNAKGEKDQVLYEPVPKDIGAKGAYLQSDSSIRCGDVAPNGDLLIGCWSDGGNSVLHFQARDWHQKLAEGAGRGFGMDNSGMKGANSLGHIIRIDKTLNTVAKTMWLAYVPQSFAEARVRGAPNGISLRGIRGLDDGKAIGFCGSSATGLIQTPGSFYKYPHDGNKYGGQFAAIFSPDFSNLLFSSYLPGCEDVSVAPIKGGMAVVSRSVGTDGKEKPTASPSVKPLQAKLSGDSDAHLIVVKLP